MHLYAVKMILFVDMTPCDGKGSAAGIAGKNKEDFWNGIKEKLTETESLSRVSLLVMRLWSSQWGGTSAGSFASLLGHRHSCVCREGARELLKQCLEVPVSVWSREASTRLPRDFWLHVCKAETECRRECKQKQRQGES